MKHVFLSALFIFVISFLFAQNINLDIKVMLEGPYSESQMSNSLNAQGLIPNHQPYNVIPWNYLEEESVVTLPSNVIDWVLIEILKPSEGIFSPDFIIKERRTGLLMADGKIKDVDGLSYLSIDSDLSAFHIRVLHRNHLPVLSSSPLSESGGVYSWDFTGSKDNAFFGMNTVREVKLGVWAMKAADGDASFQIDNKDKIEVWLPEINNNGYLNADYNMDGMVELHDINGIWSANTGSGTMDFRSSEVLKVCSENGRYFCKGDEAVYLTGSHTWDNFQDIGIPFIFEDYINWMYSLNHNFMRLWVWETPKGTNWAKDNDHDISPNAYALVDGKYDAHQLNEVFFNRLKDRIQLAADHNIYVSVMLFQGFSAEHDPIAWNYHPLKNSNNINGIDAGPNDVHTNLNPDVIYAQQLYIREVIDLVNANGFDNVLYEIGNEIDYSVESDQWHNDMINYIHDYEFNTYGINRPVGKTFQYVNGTNEHLFNSPADWISPNSAGGFDCREGDAPIAMGEKVIISDSDHLYYEWYSNNGHPVDLVWKSFTGGINICHMDNWGGGDNLPGRLLGWPSSETYDVVRNNMGYARLLSESLDLLAMLPQPQLSSTGFCIASQTEYVVYLPEAVSQSSVDLSASTGQFSVEWLDSASGNIIPSTNISAGGNHNFTSPFSEYSILILRKIY
jgi:hypothetical protein